MKDLNYRIIFPLLTLIIPLNVYVIGDWLGSGIQWAFFRYQETYAGISIIPFLSDFGYILSGAIVGRSALSLMTSGIGCSFLIATFCIVLFTLHDAKDTWMKLSGTLIIAGGISMIFSSILQYGIAFSGPAGFLIPVGVPLIIIIGILMFTGYYETLLPDMDDDGFDEDDDDATESISKT